MQQIEIVELRHLRHARRQRQIIRRIIEQRIARNFHLVVMDVGFRPSQPDGLRVRNEMDVVTALSQFQSQFRGHHAASAVRRITGDPDLHAREFAFRFLSFDGRNMRWLQILHEWQGSVAR